VSAPAPSQVYRETFLRERFKADRRRVVRRYGELLEALTSEAVAMCPRFDRFDHLAAIAVDLDYAAGLLEEHSVEHEGSYLALRTKSLAKSVRGVAGHIRRDLADKAAP
jgi:hypothetical protein